MKLMKDQGSEINKIRDIHIAPLEEHFEKYSFSGERINHWLRQCNRIKRTTTLLPSRGHIRK
jgi:hypothetical protein